MSQYYYLVASLPMLTFGMKMPFSYTNFLEQCKEGLNFHDMALIKRVKIGPFEDTEDPSPILREWKRFDTTLRNELARCRASKKSKDVSTYIRGEGYLDPFVSSFAHWACKCDSPLEAEISLDRFRWDRIEELGKWHYFDIGYLVTYSLKLQILERWERINKADGAEVLQRALRKEFA